MFQNSIRILAHDCLWASFPVTAKRTYVKTLWKSVQVFEERYAGEQTSTHKNAVRHWSTTTGCGHQKKQGKANHQGTREGHGADTKDVQISRNMSWLLRHGAKKQGLSMRPDGYVRVKDLLNHPSLRTVDFLTLEQIVKHDSKKRFHLLYEPHAYNNPGGSTQTDLWWIRANQGHSMSQVELNLKRILSAGQIPMAVHGTSIRAWESIAVQGLSKMGRNHIHLAQGVAGENVISGMRSSSQILIYINVQKGLAAGLKFYLSSNGVVLTEGNELGFLEPQFFERVERVHVEKGPVPGWEGVLEGLISNEREHGQANGSDDDESPPLLEGNARTKNADSC